MSHEGSRRETYRAGAGAAAEGDCPGVVATTGYFAHAVSPTSNVISASASVVDFSCEYMESSSFSMATSMCTRSASRTNRR